MPGLRFCGWYSYDIAEVGSREVRVWTTLLPDCWQRQRRNNRRSHCIELTHKKLEQWGPKKYLVCILILQRRVPAYCHAHCNRSASNINGVLSNNKSRNMEVMISWTRIDRRIKQQKKPRIVPNRSPTGKVCPINYNDFQFGERRPPRRGPGPRSGVGRCPGGRLPLSSPSPPFKGEQTIIQTYKYKYALLSIVNNWNLNLKKQS